MKLSSHATGEEKKMDVWIKKFQSSNLFFGLATIKSVNLGIVYPANPEYPRSISQYTESWTYPPGLPRLILANALKKNEQMNLSKKLNITTNHPIKTALGGDISFKKKNIKHIFNELNLTYRGTDEIIQSYHILDSNFIKNQRLVKFIEDNSKLNKIELAEYFPL